MVEILNPQLEYAQYRVSETFTDVALQISPDQPIPYEILTATVQPGEIRSYPTTADTENVIGRYHAESEREIYGYIETQEGLFFLIDAPRGNTHDYAWIPEESSPEAALTIRQNSQAAPNLTEIAGIPLLDSNMVETQSRLLEFNAENENRINLATLANAFKALQEQENISEEAFYARNLGAIVPGEIFFQKDSGALIFVSLPEDDELQNRIIMLDPSLFANILRDNGIDASPPYTFTPVAGLPGYVQFGGNDIYFNFNDYISLLNLGGDPTTSVVDSHRTKSEISFLSFTEGLSQMQIEAMYAVSKTYPGNSFDMVIASAEEQGIINLTWNKDYLAMQGINSSGKTVFYFPPSRLGNGVGEIPLALTEGWTEHGGTITSSDGRLRINLFTSTEFIFLDQNHKAVWRDDFYTRQEIIDYVCGRLIDEFPYLENGTINTIVEARTTNNSLFIPSIRDYSSGNENGGTVFFIKDNPHLSTHYPETIGWFVFVNTITPFIRRGSAGTPASMIGGIERVIDGISSHVHETYGIPGWFIIMTPAD